MSLERIDGHVLVPLPGLPCGETRGNDGYQPMFSPELGCGASEGPLMERQPKADDQ